MAKQTLIQKSRRVPPSEKASFHVLQGAGKSKTIRDFFGLSDKDEQAIEQELDQALQVNLQRQG
jgi:phage gpG-like protein